MTWFNQSMSRLMIKPSKWHVRQAKAQISLGIRPVWLESSLSAWIKLWSLATHWAHSEDYDQTGRMPRLIWVFAGRIDPFIGFVTRRLILSDYSTDKNIILPDYLFVTSYGPRQANLVLIAYANSEGSGEPAHPRILARTFGACTYKQWVKRNLQTESQIPGPSEWLGKRS